MAIKFSDRVFGANVSPKIIKKFKELAGGGFKKEADVNVGLKGGDRDLEADLFAQQQPAFKKYLGDRTTFARMWTANLITGSQSKKVTYNIVNDNRGKSYEPNAPIGDNVFNELAGSEDVKGNPYLKPKAGITSILSKTEGSLGAIKLTDVEFVVHNKRDFETIFLPYFLKPGSTVVVDYGWSDKSFEPYDVSERITNEDLELSNFKDYIYGGTAKESIGFINEDNNLGLVDTIIGKVTDYNASVNQQGSFECSVTLVSENTSLLDSEITEDNNFASGL